MTVSLGKSSPTFLGTALSTKHKGKATFRHLWKLLEDALQAPESMNYGRGSLGLGTGHPAPAGGRGLCGPWETMSWVTDFQWPGLRVRAECSFGHPPGKPGTSKKSGASHCLGTQAQPLWFHCPKNLGLLCGLKWLLQTLLPIPLPFPPSQQYTWCQGPWRFTHMPVTALKDVLRKLEEVGC